MDADLLGLLAVAGRTKVAFGDTGSGGVTGGSVKGVASRMPRGGIGTGGAVAARAPQAPIKPPAMSGNMFGATTPNNPGGAWYDNADQAYSAHNQSLNQYSQQQSKGWTDPDTTSWRNGSLNPMKWDWFSGGAGAPQANSRAMSQFGQGLMNSFRSNPQAHTSMMTNSPLGALGFAAMMPGGLESIQKIIGDPSQLGQQAAQKATAAPAAPAGPQQRGFFGRAWDGVTSTLGHAGGLAKGLVSTVAGGAQALGSLGSKYVGKATGWDGLRDFGQAGIDVGTQAMRSGMRDTVSNSIGLLGNAVDTIPGADSGAEALLGASKSIGTDNVRAMQAQHNQQLANDPSMAWAAPVHNTLNTVANTAAESIPATAAGGGTIGTQVLGAGARGAGTLNVAGQMATGAMGGGGTGNVMAQLGAHAGAESLMH